MNHTRSIRATDQLFVQCKSPYGPVTKTTVSNWVAKLIRELVQRPAGVRTHVLRGQAASKAWFARIPLEEILKAATWKTPSTFVACYLTNTVSTELSFSRAVLTVPDRR